MMDTIVETHGNFLVVLKSALAIAGIELIHWLPGFSLSDFTSAGQFIKTILQIAIAIATWKSLPKKKKSNGR